ncbi:MAG: Holliday junction branch migration protein RuvA [Lachnospiraceae bacterium]|nr:Holliday junction branch migration protein RuvA [Lachnospiraceae bacterium]
MIAFLRGELSAIYDEKVIIEVSGIGYNVMMPSSCIASLPGIGNEVKVYTFLSVREDAMQLYGFNTSDELELYRMLITVNGIGPKAALSILSSMTGDDLKFAILSSDSKTISKVPGIGPKTAQRLIIDLKDKIDLINTFEHKLAENTKTSAKLSSAKNEAVEALVALGYSNKDAYAAVTTSELDDSASVEEILKSALRNISRL